MEHFTTGITSDLRNAKNELLLNIARQVLKREPEESDAGKFTLVTNGGPVEVLLYQDVVIGNIEYSYNHIFKDSVPAYQYPLGFKFTPAESFR